MQQIAESIKKLFTKPNIIAIGTILVFLIFKLTRLYYRFGDGDVYLYMINQISHGIFPYKDFFIADPPGLLIFLSGIKLFLGQNWLMYQAIPVLLEAINSWLIYSILKKQQITLAWLAPILYLFSFTVLSTSDFLTGVQLTIFFYLTGRCFYGIKTGDWSRDFLELSHID